MPAPAAQESITTEPGEVLLFPDGLRYDVARQLQQELEVMGITGSLTTRWAGLATVTAIAKPAITPLIAEIQGQALPVEFAQVFRSGKPTSAAELRNSSAIQGYTMLGMIRQTSPQVQRRVTGWKLATWITADCSSKSTCRGRSSRRSSGWRSESRNTLMPAGLR